MTFIRFHSCEFTTDQQTIYFRRQIFTNFNFHLFKGIVCIYFMIKFRNSYMDKICINYYLLQLTHIARAMHMSGIVGVMLP